MKKFKTKKMLENKSDLKLKNRKNRIRIKNSETNK